ncbi:P2X purinoceptor 4 [Labeo rohita]|uniref:P2X purinoceptor 4 n=1 Tax=Labeo rohita TaxID=84645 RepID=A0ABQ8MSU6_LABRO|nr:P2X purinoceptor 4 [Labeo rohita]
MSLRGCYDCVSSCCFEYSTSKILVIRNKKAGVLNRFTQALVIAYVIGYVCVFKKGYQDTDTVLSSVTTKLKGIALTNTTELGEWIWDVADYVIPPQVVFQFDEEEIKCPLTLHWSHYLGPPLLAAAENFTVFIKNNICYPKFNFNKRNILPDINSSYLALCVFSRKTDPDCPIFRLKDIVREADEDFQTMAVHGGVMGVHIQWDCNLDMPHSWCVPQYTFRRLHNKNPQNNISQGYNFRFAKYYKNSDGTEIRTLIKGYGIRFDVMVFGQVRHFDLFNVIM